jgi:hypothetical protein
MTYALVFCQGRYLIVAEDRIEALVQIFGDIKVVKKIAGASTNVLAN